jgi:quinol monooxygenase YgiN
MSGFRIFISGTVKDGKVEAFRDLGRRMSEQVAANEPGTTLYDWHVSDEGGFVNDDGYVDDAAFLTHFGSAQEAGHIDEYVSLVDIDRVMVFGEPGDAAREALVPFGAVYYETFQSLAG